MHNTSIVLTVTTLFAMLLTTVIGLSESAGAQDSLAETKRSESPFACNRLALTPEQRNRHFDELGPKLRSFKKSVRELPNGYEFEFSPDSKTVQLVTEWAVGERACCPFFDIDMRWEREGGSLWLALTGRKGVKEFIRADGAAWIKR
jgi:hypothetical protein